MSCIEEKDTIESELNDEQLEKKAIDQQEKLQLLIEHLKGYCNDKSEHRDLRKLGKALENGAKLTGTVISGGYTNYSYKIHLEDDKNLAVYAKVAFPFALWDPSRDAHYDLSRVTSEFELMKRFSKELNISMESGTMKSPVPTPYELIDIPAAEDGAYPNMKIFVSEWVAPTDEQWGNQFIEGEVDNRVIDQCAKTLAMINLADCDGDFNQEFTECFMKIASGLAPLILGVVEQQNDKVVVYARDVLGIEKMESIVKNWEIASQQKECLVHGDAHVFNMLVERKPNALQLTNSFGPEGDFFLCDWEMARVGSKGQDISNFLAHPVLSACFLAARGHMEKADGILCSVKQFWNTYKKSLVEGLRKKQAKSSETINVDEYVADVFHSAIGTFGYFSYICFYLLKCFVEFMDTEGLTEAETDTVLAVVGWIGLRSMEVGYLETSAEQVFGDHDQERLSRMESFFFGMIETQMNDLFIARQVSRRRSRRRSSILRETSRRVSDSASGFGRISRRLSTQMAIEE